MGVGNILQVVLSLSLSCGRDAYCLMHYVLKKEFSEWIQDGNLTIFINDDILHWFEISSSINEGVPS